VKPADTMTAPACPRCGTARVDRARWLGSIECLECGYYFNAPAPKEPRLDEVWTTNGRGERVQFDADLREALAVVLAVHEGEELAENVDDPPLGRVERVIHECQRLRDEKREREAEHTSYGNGKAERFVDGDEDTASSRDPRGSAS